MSGWTGRREGWLAGRSRARPPEVKKELPQPEKQIPKPLEEFEYAVFWTPIVCPKCRSRDVRCYSSNPPVRYHFCKKCETRFKSVEQEPFTTS